MLRGRILSGVNKICKGAFCNFRSSGIHICSLLRMQLNRKLTVKGGEYLRRCSSVINFLVKE